MTVFLFVTANSHEKSALNKRFIRNNEAYILGKKYCLGRFGYYDAAHIHIDKQGVTNPASTPLVGELIRFLKPFAVIMVGIAFGANEKKQKIGDVLVSECILPYDSQKILETETRYKEPPQVVGFQLLNAFNDSDDWICSVNPSLEPKVFVGSILTGSRLVNSYEYRAKLLKDFSEYDPIGGEMEAFGIYSTCKIHGIAEWIIVKGICDWAYNKNNPNKEHDQELAANTAVDFCLHVLSRKRAFSFEVEKDIAAVQTNETIMLSSSDQDTPIGPRGEEGPIDDFSSNLLGVVSSFMKTLIITQQTAVREDKYTAFDGGHYEGSVLNGKRHGLGKYTWENGEDYIGEWVNDVRCGRGKFRYMNGDVYDGGWEDNQRVGYGEYTWKNGDVHIGHWTKNASGRGKRILASCDFDDGVMIEDGYYDGIWENGIFCTGKIYVKLNNGDYCDIEKQRDKVVGKLYDDGDLYEGEMDLEFFPNGSGVCVFADGDTYNGTWKEGWMDGYGVFTSAEGGRFEGSYAHGKRVGKGEYTSKNHWKYEGSWVDGKLDKRSVRISSPGGKSMYEGEYANYDYNGYGVMTWLSGQVYEGNWKEGKRCGKGRMVQANGCIYDGEWKDDKYHGQGAFDWPDGMKFEGEWKGGERCHGIQSWPNGMIYEGEYSNNRIGGLGTLLLLNGKEYIGDFVEGKMCGHGKMTWPDGREYEGDFVENKISGYGKMSWSNGDEFCGEWLEDQPDGQGEMHFVSGTVYIGAMKNGKRNGYGKYESDEGWIFEGEWIDNLPCGQGKMIYKDGEIYEGEFVDGKKHGFGRMIKINGEVFNGEWVNDMFKE